MIQRPRLPHVPRSTLILILSVAALAFPLGVLATHQFSDVPTGASYHDDVEALVDAGITTGCTATTYCPTQAVTRGQMAQFLNRLGSLDGNTPPSVDADELDGLDSSAFARPMFAVVNADGSLARGAGVSSSSAIIGFDGSYQVIFNRDVTTCSYTATIGNPGGGNPDPGFIVTALRAGTTDGVFVETRSTADALADRPFHLEVSCVAGEGQVTIGVIQDAPGADGANTD